MASISNDGDGYRRLLFTRPVDRKRVAIRLGKISARDANIIRSHVESLVSSVIRNMSMTDETSRWLAGIGESLHESLAEHGLISARRRVQLGEFIESYIAARKDVGRGTATNYGIIRDRLLAFFEPTRYIHDITPGDAHAWLVYLRAAKQAYADATIAKTIKVVRQFFLSAKRSRLIDENPFDTLKAPKQTNEAKMHFVTRANTEKVIAAAPNAEWRLIIALSRYGGLRCPSEHLVLNWDDINWEQRRFRVDSPKSGERWVPIFPDLRPYLEEAFELAEPGQVQVIARCRDAKNLRTPFRKMIRKAGLTPWPRTFHNLRSTRETELCETFPLHVVAKWLGNSPKTASAHYLQVTDEHFKRGASGEAAQFCAHDDANLRPIMATPESEKLGKSQEMQEIKLGRVTPTGSELSDGNHTGKSTLRQEASPSGAELCALSPSEEWELFKTAWLAGDIE